MRDCLDEGILQSYFDRELGGAQMKNVASHLAACDSCSAAARELQTEINLLATALAPEFESSVPTERLRQRIDAAVAGVESQATAQNESSTFSLRAWLQSLVAPLSFTPQRAFGYAGLILVLGFGLVLGITQFRNAPTQVAVQTGNSKPVITPSDGPISKGTTALMAELPSQVAAPPVRKDGYVRPQNVSANKAATRPQPAAVDDKVKLLPGERSYLQTIAKLDSSIKSDSSRTPMRPALQAEYERNLALVDRALAATRNAAKKNPNDPDAAEFMMSAYQNKVNLLNAVAEARTFNRDQN